MRDPTPEREGGCANQILCWVCVQNTEDSHSQHHTEATETRAQAVNRQMLSITGLHGNNQPTVRPRLPRGGPRPHPRKQQVPAGAGPSGHVSMWPCDGLLGNTQGTAEGLGPLESADAVHRDISYFQQRHGSLRSPVELNRGTCRGASHPTGTDRVSLVTTWRGRPHTRGWREETCHGR